MAEIDYVTEEAIFRFNLDELRWLLSKIPPHDAFTVEIEKAIENLDK